MNDIDASIDYPRCRTCKWWRDDNEKGPSVMATERGDMMANLGERLKDEALEQARYLDENDPAYAELRARFPEVRVCSHPKLVFYEMPLRDGAAVLDGSGYKAQLVPAEDYGCVNHESGSA